MFERKILFLAFLASHALCPSVTADLVPAGSWCLIVRRKTCFSSSRRQTTTIPTFRRASFVLPLRFHAPRSFRNVTWWFLHRCLRLGPDDRCPCLSAGCLRMGHKGRLDAFGVEATFPRVVAQGMAYSLPPYHSDISSTKGGRCQGTPTLQYLNSGQCAADERLFFGFRLFLPPAPS